MSRLPRPQPKALKGVGGAVRTSAPAKTPVSREGAAAGVDVATATDSNRYAQLLEAVGEPVVTVDSHHRIVEFNSEAERIFGYPKAEILGQSINVLLLEDNRGSHDRHIKNFATELTQRRLMRERADVRGRRKDGQEFDAEVSIAKIEIAGELHFMAIMRDVSVRKKLERDLRESDQHLRQAQQLAGLASWEHDVRTGKVRWSAPIYDIFGIDSEAQQPSAELFFSKIHPDDRLALRQRFGEVLANHGTTMSADLRIIRPDGTETILHELSELTWGGDGQLLRQIGTLQDVTEQRATATRLRQSERLLSRSQELAHLGSWEHEVLTGKVTWSAQMYEIFGIDPATQQASSELFLSMLHPDDRELQLERFNRLLTDPTTIMSADLRIIRSDGTERILHELSDSTWGDDGKLVRQIGTMQDVTELRATAKRLQQSERLLNRAQELAHLGSWDHNEVTGEINWSRNFFAILGLDPQVQRPSYDRFFASIHTDDQAAVRERFEKALSDRVEAASYDTRIIRGDGIERALRNTVEYFWAENGDLLRVSGTSQDITEQLEVAERLARSEHSLANAQRIAHIGSWDWNFETDALFWSDEIYRIFSLDPDAVAPSHSAVMERVHPDDRERLEANIAAAVSGERPFNHMHRIVLPSGAVRTVHEQGEVIFSADGRALHMTGAVQDVTESKQATDELELSESSLEQAQRIANIGSWEANLLTGEFRWSTGLYVLSGLDPAKHKPDIDLFMSLIHPDDRAGVLERTNRVLTGAHEKESGTFRLVRTDGIERVIHSEVGVIRDQEGRPTRVIGSSQDVTEQLETERALKAAFDAARSADKAKSEFLANMSHELRTPLNAIIGFAEILGTERLAPSLTARDREYAQDIRDSGLHLLDIINDVLDFSRVEAGSADIRDEPIDTSALMAWVVKLLGEKARAKDLRLTTAVMPEATGFRGDLRLIRQALLNIVGNAIKFTVSGEIALTAMRTGDGSFTLSVSDTGIGMRPEDIPAALTPFTQLENALQRHYEGVGLGFPLAKRFVELHDGAFDVASELQKGTTVTITLPAWRCEDLDVRR